MAKNLLLKVEGYFHFRNEILEEAKTKFELKWLPREVIKSYMFSFVIETSLNGMWWYHILTGQKMAAGPRHRGKSSFLRKRVQLPIIIFCCFEFSNNFLYVK